MSLRSRRFSTDESARGSRSNRCSTPPGSSWGGAARLLPTQTSSSIAASTSRLVWNESGPSSDPTTTGPSSRASLQGSAARLPREGKGLITDIDRLGGQRASGTRTYALDANGLGVRQVLFSNVPFSLTLRVILSDGPRTSRAEDASFRLYRVPGPA